MLGITKPPAERPALDVKATEQPQYQHENNSPPEMNCSARCQSGFAPARGQTKRVNAGFVSPGKGGYLSVRTSGSNQDNTEPVARGYWAAAIAASGRTTQRAK
jgi:hypothetical protein